MNRASAQRIASALREVGVDRGATPAEADVAARKLKSLTARYGLDSTPPPRSRPRRARPAPRAGHKQWVGGEQFATARPMPDWQFDIKTGKGSDNVKVHHYGGKYDWRIEIEL